jgi:AcrR family transcriptional regulator
MTKLICLHLKLMSKKELILQEALTIFNSKGFEHVSTYDIAKKAGMSQGNFTYHYPTKQILINTLAKKMINEIDHFILNVDDNFSPTQLKENFKRTFEINIKYKFIYLNYSQIVLNDPDLNEYFISNAKGRKVLLKKMLTILSKNDYLISDDLINLTDQLADIINLIAVYWIPESAIYHSTKSNKEIINHHLDLLFLPFQPFLTKKGKLDLQN